jgi:hypothetical protein
MTEKRKKTEVTVDLRPSSSGWGLPVRYQAPPRFLVVSLVVAFVGLAAIGPSIFSIEALGGLLRQVIAIARTVHLAEQLRDPQPAPQVASPASAPPPSPEWAAQSDGSYKLRAPAQTTHTASGITYHDRVPAPAQQITLVPPPEEPTRAADPSHAALVQLNMAVSDAEDLVAQWQRTPDLVDPAALTAARELLATMRKCVPDRATMLRGGPFAVPP